MARAKELYDEIRIDHFRGFAGYWAVPAEETTAMNGSWKKGPGKALFDSLRQQLGEINILAEDLGVITEDVKALRETVGAPGMVVLQFAWGGGPTNTHLPHNHYENCFVYVGTHDNDTTVGWWEKILEPERRVLRSYLGIDARDIAWDLMRLAASSVARTAVFTMPVSRRRPRRLCPLARRVPAQQATCTAGYDADGQRCPVQHPQHNCQQLELAGRGGGRLGSPH